MLCYRSFVSLSPPSQIFQRGENGTGKDPRAEAAPSQWQQSQSMVHSLIPAQQIGREATWGVSCR